MASLSPAHYGVWGSVVSSLSGIQGGVPAENETGAPESCQKAGIHFEYPEVHVLQQIDQHLAQINMIRSANGN